MFLLGFLKKIIQFFIHDNMDALLFYLIFFIIIAVVLFIIPYILYLIPKKFEHSKLGKILSGFYIIILIYSYIDEINLTKNEIKEILNEHHITLKDDFKIDNETYYSHKHFALKISERDKQRIIQKIKNSKNFKTIKDTIPPNFYEIKFGTKDYYFGEKLIQNYETQNEFVTEFFQPANKEDNAPKYKQVSINKHLNHLVYTDIYEYIIDP